MLVFQVSRFPTEKSVSPGVAPEFYARTPEEDAWVVLPLRPVLDLLERHNRLNELADRLHLETKIERIKQTSFLETCRMTVDVEPIDVVVQPFYTPSMQVREELTRFFLEKDVKF